MAIDTSQFAADLGAMIEDLPGSMTAAFVTGAIDVSLAELTAEQTLIITGHEGKQGFACTLPVAGVTRTPVPQDRVVITGQGESGGTNYQIMRVLRAADGVAFTLFLIQDSRKPV